MSAGSPSMATRTMRARSRELEAGYAIDPRREFLFAEAQALRLNGDCKGAVPLYKKFLDSRPDDVQTNATHIALGRCAEQMASKPAEVAAPAAGVAKGPSTALAATMPAPRAPPPPWYQDVAGGVLLGGGVAALAIGTAFSFAARSARDDANQSSSTYAEYAQHWAAARERTHVAIGAFSVGAAFTGAAIYRYLRVRQRPAATGINVWCQRRRGHARRHRGRHRGTLLRRVAGTADAPGGAGARRRCRAVAAGLPGPGGLSLHRARAVWQRGPL